MVGRVAASDLGYSECVALSPELQYAVCIAVITTADQNAALQAEISVGQHVRCLMEFVHVATPQSESELSVMVSMLDANDIPHFVQNSGFGGLLPGMKMHLLNIQRVMVPTNHASDASALLAVFLQPAMDFETDI